jgi:hypothetical protein
MQVMLKDRIVDCPGGTTPLIGTVFVGNESRPVLFTRSAYPESHVVFPVFLTVTMAGTIKPFPSSLGALTVMDALSKVLFGAATTNVWEGDTASAWPALFIRAKARW